MALDQHLPIIPITLNGPFDVLPELARRIKTKKEAKAFLDACQGASFAIDDITTRPIKKTPPAPFTTSTLHGF